MPKRYIVWRKIEGKGGWEPITGPMRLVYALDEAHHRNEVARASRNGHWHKALPEGTTPTD